MKQDDALKVEFHIAMGRHKSIITITSLALHLMVGTLHDRKTKKIDAYDSSDTIDLLDRKYEC